VPDLKILPLPYSTSFFDHVIAVAVLNSFNDLAALFSDIARVMKADGIFAFTVEDQQPGQAASYLINRAEVTEQPDAESAVLLHRHNESYITGLLDQDHDEVLKTFEFVAFKYPAENKDILFKAYITRKKR
jgi:SAM-dependent methyltransferase